MSARPLPTLASLPPVGDERRGWPWSVATSALAATRADGSPWPRISIVTPVYNQGHYLEETLRSLLLQGYPQLEAIVIDDGSTDDSAAVIRRYEPWLSFWTTQSNQGQAAAINHGFGHATGAVYGYLNSDDLLLPGTLARVAREIDPAHGRHVVMGRCKFTDAESRDIGVEHPSRFTSHERVLRVWKGHTIPQPSVFWTPRVWSDCGPMIEDLGPAWIDYGLFCRMSRRYSFHFVDQLFSTYRLHDESKTQKASEQQRLDEAIAISRRYWGPRHGPRFWRLQLSLWRFRFDRWRHGNLTLRRSGEANRHGRRLRMLAWGALGALVAPDVAFYRVVYPRLRDLIPEPVRRRLLDLAHDDPGQTLAYSGHADVWSDGWVGPLLRRQLVMTEAPRVLEIAGSTECKYLAGPLVLDIRMNGRKIGEVERTQDGAWCVELPVGEPLAPGAAAIEVRANASFVPHRLLRNGDSRPLSWRLHRMEFRY